MSRVNPFALTVPKRRVETRTFADPNHPGIEFSFTLGTRNFVVISRAQSCQEELIEKWTGDDQPGFPVATDGEGPVYVDRVMCQAAASAWAMQAGPEAEQYTADEMLAFEVTAPVAFEGLMGWLAEMNADVGHPDRNGAAPGNVSEAGMAASSWPRSPAAISTPSSSITSPTASGASTSALPDERDPTYLRSTPTG